MTRPKISSKEYQARLALARKASGGENQSNWRERLRTAMKPRPKPAGKPVDR